MKSLEKPVRLWRTIMSKKIEDILIEEGFTVEVDSIGEIEIRQTTPAGEDWGSI